MRIIWIIAVIGISHLFGTVTFASTHPIPKKNIQVLISRNLGIVPQESLFLFQEKKAWICHTENFPHMELDRNPLAQIPRLKWKKATSCETVDESRSNLDTAAACNEGSLRICDRTQPARIRVYQDCIENDF